MRIVWIGFHIEGKLAFTSILKLYNIVGFISLTKEAVQKRSAAFNYKKLCKKNNIPYWEINNINDDNSVALLKSLEPDLMIVLGWSQILKEKVLSIPKIGTIGAHASLLPEYRGSAPVNWALINGLEKTGNTLMWLDSGVDTGIIIDQMSFSIEKYDSCKEVYEKVSKTNEVMLLRNLKKIEQVGVFGEKQDRKNHETILPRRKPADGLINFNSKSIEIYNFIRALTKPYPGAFFYFDNKKYLVWKAAVIENYNTKEKSGQVLEHLYSFVPELCGIIISTSQGAIIIYEIEVEKHLIFGKELHKIFGLGKILNE